MDKINLLVVLGLGIIVLPILWRITDPRPSKERKKDFTDKKLMTILLLEMTAIILQIVSGLQFPWSIGPYNNLTTLSGLIVFYCGILIAGWAKIVMKKSWGYPGQHDANRQTALVTSGPFRFSRNPIYLGLILLNLGLSIAVRSYFIFLSVFTYVYFNGEVKKEEKLLEKNFGNKYVEYKKRVRRFI